MKTLKQKKVLDRFVKEKEQELENKENKEILEDLKKENKKILAGKKIDWSRMFDKFF